MHLVFGQLQTSKKAKTSSCQKSNGFHLVIYHQGMRLGAYWNPCTKQRDLTLVGLCYVYKPICRGTVIIITNDVMIIIMP